MHATVFPNKRAEEMRDTSIAALLATIADPPLRPHKDACELFSLGHFGDKRTEKNCLRHDENVQAITGIAGDYDGEQVPMDRARDALGLFGVECTFYTSPSHKPEAPRWRAVCRLSREHPKSDHAHLMARLNGALGGVLAPESFAASRSYYFGKVKGAEYQVLTVPGLCIDEIDELDDFAVGKNGPAKPGNGAEPHAGKMSDDELRDLILRGVPGRIYTALLSLTSRLAGRGNTAEQIVADLGALLNEAAWQSADPITWQERVKALPKMATSAVAKYAPRKRADSDAPKITAAMARLPADWVEAEQRPPPFIVAGLLPQAEAGSVVGPGGTWKSTLKLYESVHLILGRDLYGRRIIKPGTVLAVSKEDRAELIDYRLKQICIGLGLSQEEMHRVHSGFLRLVLRGEDFLLQRMSSTERIPFRSNDVADLVATFQGEGIVSAWLDTASRFATGEGNQEAKVTVDAATVIADAWQCAVELLHHVSQGIARTGIVDQHAGRGGTAFVDDSRFGRQFVVQRPGDTALPGAPAYNPPPGIDPDAEVLVRMHVVKLTGARHDIHTPIWVERRGEWEFVCAEGEAGGRVSREARQGEQRSKQADADDAAVLAFIQAAVGAAPPKRLTQNALLETRDKVVRGISAQRTRDAVGRLKHDGKLVELPMPGVVTRGAREFLAPAGWQEPLL